MASHVITELAQKYAPWSWSKAETADVCPAQFIHKHVLKTASGSATSDTKVGIAAHEILEHRLIGKPVGVARKAAEEKTPLTTNEREMLHTLDEGMEDFLRRFDLFCKKYGVKQIMAEVAWGFTAQYTKTEFFAKDVYFRGKVDLCAITRDNDLYVIDHKSGTPKDLKRDQKKRQQLQAYAVLALPNLPDIGGVRGGINFIQAGNDERIQWADYIPAARVRDLYAGWLFQRINDAASNLKEPYEARPGKKMTGWPCHWCTYQAECSAFQEKFVIKNLETETLGDGT